MNYRRKSSVMTGLTEGADKFLVKSGNAVLILMLLAILALAIFPLVMSIVGLINKKDTSELKKDEWKAYFSINLIVSLFGIITVLFLYWKIEPWKRSVV